MHRALLLLAVACDGADSDGRHPASSGEAVAVPQATTLWGYGTQAFDEAGRYLSVGDADGDGLADVLVGAASGVIYGTDASSASVYLLRRPDASGPLDDVATAVFSGEERGDFFGDSVVVLAQAGLVVVTSAALADHETPVRLYDGASAGVTPIEEAVARLNAPDWREVGLQNVADCQGANLGAGVWCSTAFYADGDDLDYGGSVTVMPAATHGVVEIEDALVTILGAPHERAEVVDGSRDLDGDGFSDLAIGSHEWSGGLPGRISVVLGAPTGVVQLDDVAVAAFTGETTNAHLGLSVHAGDLDGDGLADVFGGAPFTDELPCVYGMRSPWLGEVDGGATDWRFCGEQWLGYGLAIGDFDGDGSPDLAAGAPANFYTAEVPGVVVIWTAPAQGRHDLDDAALVLWGGRPEPDSFGTRIGAGDFDGDGLDDLAIGAPRVSEFGERAGAVAIVFGAGLDL